MAIEQLEELRKAVESKFDATKEQIARLSEELLKLQGEYQAYTKLIDQQTADDVPAVSVVGEKGKK